jgi:hypothetical protein
VKTRESLDRKLAEREEKLQQQMKNDKSRKSTNAMDYVMALDGSLTFLDGYERAKDRSSFSPVHMNHADKATVECNCVRLLKATNQIEHGREKCVPAEDVPYCVAFFTSRDVQANEKLCFDYGSSFWKGREDQKL